MRDPRAVFLTVGTASLDDDDASITAARVARETTVTMRVRAHFMTAVHAALERYDSRAQHGCAWPRRVAPRRRRRARGRDRGERRAAAARPRGRRRRAEAYLPARPPLGRRCREREGERQLRRRARGAWAPPPAQFGGSADRRRAGQGGRAEAATRRRAALLAVFAAPCRRPARTGATSTPTLTARPPRERDARGDRAIVAQRALVRCRARALVRGDDGAAHFGRPAVARRLLAQRLATLLRVAGRRAGGSSTRATLGVAPRAFARAHRRRARGRASRRRPRRPSRTARRDAQRAPDVSRALGSAAERG